MLMPLKNILQPEEVAEARSLLGDQAAWIDGRSSAGSQAQSRKNNEQLAQDSAGSRTLQELVRAALRRDPLFFSAALPRKIFNPLFNRYSGESNAYGSHVDGAVLHSRSTDEWVRSDVSCTLFLSDPASYDGGELVVQDAMGEQRIKLPAGDLVMYPGTRVHRVTRGARLACFFWVESMVRSEEHRRLLFDLDMNLLALRQRHGETPETTALTGTYHNLLRLWANT